MKLSEALVLKAEWWIAPAREYLDVEIEKLLDSELPETDWYYLASRAVKNNTGYHFRGTDTESYLCLLESELQKDIELANIQCDMQV